MTAIKKKPPAPAIPYEITVSGARSRSVLALIRDKEIQSEMVATSKAFNRARKNGRGGLDSAGSDARP